MTRSRNSVRNMTRIASIAAAMVAASFGMEQASRAAGWNPLPGIFPTAGDAIPSPIDVPGKDYSHYGDWDDLGFASPEQVIAWDGFGGTRNAQNYLGSRPYPGVTQPIDTDGIANAGDALYFEAISDRSALLFSVGTTYQLAYSPFSPPPPLVLDAAIYYEGTAANGTNGIWAIPPVVDSKGPRELDGLELWGDNQNDDSDRYSVYGDPFAEIAPGIVRKVAVWAFSGGVSTPHTLTFDLAVAMDMQYGFGGTGPLFGQLVELMDVDAIMVSGDQVMFSIAPLDLSALGPLPNFDGGEIFVYTPGGATTFLNHGGHLWDTAFDVMGTFGVQTENDDALEAVSAIPAPTRLARLALGLAGLGRRRRA